MIPSKTGRETQNPSSTLARQAGRFGTIMALVGRIACAGIFINPYQVAERGRRRPYLWGAWVAGGLIALVGGLRYTSRRF